MQRITVNTLKPYDVLIGNGLLSQIDTLITDLHTGQQVAIISDANVWPLYGSKLTTSLLNRGITPIHYVVPAGEGSKSGNIYFEILNFLAENHMTRTDYLLALGGGVVGDITGFVAATYLRGIPYVQIPTSLLAMVDSSVGGKTAINIASGKNLVGAFYQPSLVICDISVLSSLPAKNFSDGCAEVIKYSILYDPELFRHLEENATEFDRQYVISRCIELKRDVVIEDEFDTSSRQKLNLGHTIGHSIEHESNFTISHGHAVAIGMAAIARAATVFNICPPSVAAQIIHLLELFALPVETQLSIQTLVRSALSDKKRRSDFINVVMPVAIGECVIRSVHILELPSIIEAGLES